MLLNSDKVKFLLRLVWLYLCNKDWYNVSLQKIVLT